MYNCCDAEITGEGVQWAYSTCTGRKKALLVRSFVLTPLVPLHLPFLPSYLFLFSPFISLSALRIRIAFDYTRLVNLWLTGVSIAQIGINYTGTKDVLHGCVNDAVNLRKFITGTPLFRPLSHLSSRLTEEKRNGVTTRETSRPWRTTRISRVCGRRRRILCVSSASFLPPSLSPSSPPLPSSPCLPVFRRQRRRGGMRSRIGFGTPIPAYAFNAYPATNSTFRNSLVVKAPKSGSRVRSEGEGEGCRDGWMDVDGGRRATRIFFSVVEEDRGILSWKQM
ncbi:hypothetical protein NMY22_g19790 [Coprinellus aureogranulatus]|nr:hypothetical protein NMY22_g19790 [Coprinellus aureogranulatus]